MGFIKNYCHVIYKKIFLRTNDKRISYYRKLGVKIGTGCIYLSGESSFGSEPYLVSLGNDCLVSGDVNFITHDGGMWVLNHLKLENNVDKFGMIHVGNNVFIGMRSIILPGITIGDNCVIGAGSIVTKSIEKNSVVAGVPAKRICSIYEYDRKNKDKFDNTYGMKPELKRQYLYKKFSLHI